MYRGVESGGVGTAMTEVVSDFLEGPPGFQKMPGTGVSQGVRAAALLERGDSREVASDYVVEAAWRQRAVWATEGQKERLVVGAWPTVAHVARDGVADPSFDRQDLLTEAL